jgi:2-C-methyl-D-erythritol 2,4-cyclodiphosphate synthase
MVIGGVPFASELNPVAHSDGDALLHAITDAVLGAIGAPDIGQLFPDKDPKWAGAPSEVFLREAVKRAAAEGWRVGNVDATVVVDRPKLGARKDEVRASVARALGVEVGRVNVKGKTPELPDPTSGGQVIEAHAVVLMMR